MDAQELRNLQEAYLEVVENQQLDEISQKLATSARDKARKSELDHRIKAHDKIKATKNIPFVSDVGREMAQPDIDKANRRARQANLADRKLGGSGQYRYDSKGNYGKEGPAKVLATKDKKTKSNESYDIYDIILSHLLDEGYAETPEAAEAIMVNMSEEWRQSIVEEVLDEAIRNPESRKKLRDIEDKEVRKGDKSKGENPRSKYSTDKGKLAGHLLRGPESTGSKGNPVRSRGGTNAPADERVGRGPHRAGNAAYWAGNAGPNRDRGAGNKSARRAGKSVPNTRSED